MPHFALQMSDGSVAIMQTVGDAKPEDCIAKWPEAEQAKVVFLRQIDKASIPTDRVFRGAWALNSDRVEPDLEKARAIVSAKLGRDDPAVAAAKTIDELRAVAGIERREGR